MSAAAAALAAPVVQRERRARAAVSPVEVAPGLAIMPRAAWGGDLLPKWTVPAEPDVRVLIVHHTTGSSAADPVETMRSSYWWHTSPEKGWVDVTYNFFIDGTGQAWEGRTGSLASPRRADATGGSQGYSQLVCMMGNFMVETPSAAQRATLVKMLAWLADRSNLATTSDPAGALTTFVSKGSNKLPVGQFVVTPNIVGHRAMTFTECPGDNLFAIVEGGLRSDVHDHRMAWRPPGRQKAVRLGLSKT